MNIAICDDEEIICLQIKEFVEKQKIGCTISIFKSGEELLENGDVFDVIFLDIQMDGINGIDTAKKIREKNKAVILIFVTAIKEYVFEAFDVSAFHYLLKPVSEDKFREIFKNAVLEASDKKQQNKAIFIKTRKKSITLSQNQILYIESHAKKVEIHTFDDAIEVYSSMKELERELAPSFYRCHRGYLVNMAYIAEYETNSIRLTNGEAIYLAKDKYREFVKTYMRYLRNGGVLRV